MIAAYVDHWNATYQKNVFDAQIGFPIFFQCVYANFTIGRHIRMEDFRKKIGLWRRLWKIFA